MSGLWRDSAPTLAIFRALVYAAHALRQPAARKKNADMLRMLRVPPVLPAGRRLRADLRRWARQDRP